MAPPRFGLTVLLLFLSLILVGCSSTGDEDPSTAPGPIVGQPVDVAGAAAEKQGKAWRVIREDDEDFAVTADYREDRLNFVVEDGVVVSAQTDEELGGG